MENPHPVNAAPGDTIRHAYFQTGEMISLLATTANGRTFEIAMISTEGMAGIPLILG